MKKTILFSSIAFSSCAILLACASAPVAAHSTTQNVNVDAGRMVSDASSDVVSLDAQKTEAQDDANTIAHQKAIDDIYSKFAKEYMQYKNCMHSDAGVRVCESMLKDFCKVSRHIDDQGTHHIKTYCDLSVHKKK